MIEEMHHAKLNAQLGAMEQRLKKIRFWRAAGHTLILFLIALGVGAIVDYLIPLNFSQRLALTLGVYGSAIAYALWGWWLPYRRPMKPEQVAWVLEDLEPAFNEKLISAVEFSGAKDQKISHDMIHAVLEDAELDLSKHQPESTFPLTARNFALPIAVAVVFIGLFFVPSFQFTRLVCRVAFPSDHQATVGSFRLIVHAPTRKKAAEADTLVYEVECTDGSVENVDLIIEDEKVRRFAMRLDATNNRYVFSQPDVQQSFRFWAQSGRVQSGKHEMTVLLRPKIKDMTLTYTFPSYTEMPPLTTTQASGGIQGYPGTQVAVTFQATKPLKSVELTELGTKRLLDIDATGTAATAQFTIEKSGEYRLTLTDTDDLQNRNEIVFPIVALEDQAPTVNILKPGGEVHLSLDDLLPLEWETSDDFGIVKQELIWTTPGRGPGMLSLDPKASTLAWALRTSGLRTGDDVTYRLRVEDAVGQVAESQTRSLSLLKDLALADSTAFRNIARTLSGELKGMVKRMGSISELETRLHANGGAAAEDLNHNQNMMTKHAQWLSDRLAETEKLSHDLKGKSFFPRAQIASELMGRYFRQERLFSTVRLNREDAPQAIASLGEMHDLNQQMTQELITKADQHVPAIQVRRLVRTARSMEAVSNKELLDGLADRAGKLAARHHPKSAEAFKDSDQLENKLNAFQVELDHKANDYAEVDRLIKAIRERLKSREDQMADLARQLKLYNQEQDWESVKEMRDALNQAAMQETENLARQADLELAAKVLDKAIEEQDADRVDEVVSRLPEMERQHELDALRDKIEQAREEAAEALAALREELADGETPKPSEALDALVHTVNQLKETPLAGEALREDAEGRKVADHMQAADQHLKQLEQALTASDPEKAKRELDQLEARMQQAEQAADQATARGEEALAKDRGALDNLKESLSEQLSEVADLMQRETPDTPVTAEAVRTASDEIDQLAEELQREAQREIARPDGDAEAARNKMAMAEALEQLNQEGLQPAAQAMKDAAHPDEVAAAREALEKALAELAQSQALSERAEQQANKELSLAESREVDAALEQLALETLPEEVIQTLETLEELRESGEDVEEMVDALENKKTPAKTMAEAVEELRQDLGHALMMEGREAFMEEAESVIAKAQRGTEELLTDTRALRAEMRDAEKMNAESREELEAEAEALARQAEALEIDLARADAVKALLQPEADPSLEPLQKEAQPNLLSAARKLDEAERTLEQAKAAPAEGQPALTPEQVAEKEKQAQRAVVEANEAMERAVAGVKEAAKALDDFAEEMPSLQPQAEQLAGLEQDTTIKPDDLKQANSRLERMKDLMQEAQAAQTAKDQLKEDLLPEFAAAAKLLEDIPELGLDDGQAQAVQKARKTFDEMNNPNEMASGLENIANALKNVDPELNKELRREAEDLRKIGKHGFEPMKELERRTEDRIREMNQEADRLASDLARLDAPEVESAEETLDQFQENIENEDLSRADKNLEAIEEDLQALAQRTGAPLPPDTLPVSLPKPDKPPALDPEALLQQNPALEQAANPETNWHERKALMEAAAVAMETPQEAKIPEAEWAAKGDLQRAAETAPMKAAADFAKAAELEAATEPTQPKSKAYQEDPTGFIEQAADQVDQAREAAEAVADAVEQGQRPSEAEQQKLAEAIDAAEAMRQEMGKSQQPAQDALEQQVEPSLATDRANFLKADEGMKQVEDALKAYAEDLNQAAEEQVAFDQIAALAKQQEALSMANKPEDAAKVGQELEALAAMHPQPDGPAETPAAFREPRKPLAAQQEQALAQQAQDDRKSLIADAQEKLEDAKQAANQAEEQLAKGQKAEPQVTAAQAAVDELEAMRDQLGARDFDAHQAMEAAVEAAVEAQASPKEAAQAMQQVKKDLAAYEQELQAEMKQQQAFEEVKELANALAQQPETAQAEKLGDALEKRNGLASQEAAKAVAALEDALKQQEAPEAAVQQAMQEVAKAVEALNPAEAPRVAPNKEAFDASAKAAALENQDALQQAEAGDYEAAAESMKALAQSLPPSAKQAQAEQAAKEFRAAREEQMEALPKPLADALTASENSALSPVAEAALEDAADAARAGDLPRASERLQEAMAEAQDPAQLAQLDEAIKDAYAAEKSAQANRSPEAQSALEAVEALSRQADPVAQVALADAAEALEQEDFGQAAARVAEAAFGLPNEGFKQAAELARELQQDEQEKYGEAVEAAREGLKQLGSAHPEIAEAAKTEDYKTAAEMAQQQGQKEAAKAFQQAADQQRAALPAPVQEGLSQLEQAIQQSNGAEQAMLKDAEKAARKGSYDQASELAAKAAEAHAAEASLANALEEAQRYNEQTIQPLENAVREAQQNHMAEAAAQAAQSPKGQEAAQALQTADQQASDAAQQAFEDAFNTPQNQGRPALENAARSAQNNQLDQAMQQAQQAGKAGEDAREALAQAKQSQEAAKQATQEALNDAKAHGPMQEAQQALEQAKASQLAASEAAQAAMQEAQQTQQALQQAQQALSQNNPAQAAQAAAKASGADSELAQQLASMQPSAPAEARRDAAQALQQAQQAAREQEQAARQTQQNAQRASQELDRAQQAMNGNRMEQASEMARQQAQGAFEAQKAAEAFAQATAEASAPQELAQASPSSGESAQNPGAEATPGQAGQAAEAQPAQAAQGEPSQAGQTPGKGAPQGGAEQAYQAQAQTGNQPMPAQAKGANPLPGQEVSAAMIQLQAAQTDLQDGKASPHTAAHLDDAAEALQQASAALAETLLDQVNHPTEGSEPAQTASQGNPQGGEGGPQGNRSPQSKAADIADLKEDFEGKKWRGPKDQLKSGDFQGDKNQYTDYYRKANAQYLEKLLKESKQDGE